jgi:preprotein translocase subunit SecG
MQTLILSIHIFLAIALIVLILVQHGKGADAGAAFGSGASSTVFGAQGSASFLTKITTFIALSFFLTSLALAYFASSIKPESGSLIDQSGDNIQKTQPAENNSSRDLP